VKYSFGSGYARRKNGEEQKEKIKTTPFIKTTTDVTSTTTSTSRQVSALAETCSETEGRSLL
jgi:hypothetical protein